MYQCGTCNKEFTLKKNLNKHIKNIHNLTVTPNMKKEGKYKCSECDLIFVAKSSLHRHERIKHTITVTEGVQIKNPSKHGTFEPSKLEDHPLLKKLVPEDYIYKINQINNLENNKFRAKFEIADCTEDIFLIWLSELEQKSETTYRVKSFTKSQNPKIVYNKVFRCIHNTFPSKNSVPHPKHTGCPATLTVRIQKCVEALYLKNSMADNNVILIPFKAIVTLYHYHNHVSLGANTIKISSTENEKQKDNNETCIYLDEIESNLDQVYTLASYNPELTISTSKSINENKKSNYDDINSTTLFEETTLTCKPENETFLINDNSQNMSIDKENEELSEEFDNFILVEHVNTEHSLHNDDNKNEILKLLCEYDNVNDRMLKQFKSNPKYFISAIKTYTLAMKNSLVSKETLLNMLNSFGKQLHE